MSSEDGTSRDLESWAVDAGSVMDKLFSTYVCDCINDDGTPAAKCINFCWKWQTLDLVETIRDWFQAADGGVIEFRNLLVRKHGRLVRGDGVARLERVEVIADFLKTMSGRFTMLYAAPVGSEWRFIQFVPREGRGEGDEWVEVLFFHSDDPVERKSPTKL